MPEYTRRYQVPWITHITVIVVLVVVVMVIATLLLVVSRAFFLTVNSTRQGHDLFRCLRQYIVW